MKSGPFYILSLDGRTIIFHSFNPDESHSSLWTRIVKEKLAPTLLLDSDSFLSLSLACYATDRGRVSVSPNGDVLLLGSVGVVPSITQIQSLYELPLNFVAMIGNDDHYKKFSADELLLEELIRFRKKGTCRNE